MVALPPWTPEAFNFPISPQGDGNATIPRAGPKIDAKCSTSQFPRKGTETRLRAGGPSSLCSYRSTSQFPRKGTETVANRSIWSGGLSSRFNFPISPQGDGNLVLDIQVQVRPLMGVQLPNFPARGRKPLWQTFFLSFSISPVQLPNFPARGRKPVRVLPAAPLPTLFNFPISPQGDGNQEHEARPHKGR